MIYDTSRHDDLFDHRTYQLDTWIFGNGGTGGDTARCLVGDGVGHEWCPLHLCDPDIFEPHNVPSQLVTFEQARTGMLKVEAVRENLLLTNPTAHIHTYNVAAPHPSLPPVSGVVFLCLDTMEARKEIIERMLEGNPNVHCVIDLRTDVPGALAYCFDPRDDFQVGVYFDMWYDDDDADEMLGCNNEHFARRSSILGAVNLAMERFYAFVENGSTLGIANYTKVLYGKPLESEIWTRPVD